MFGGHAWIILVLILAIVLILIGPGKLSHLGGALGQSVKEFRKSQGDSTSTEPPKQTE
jgi:TatA/E family protein of Tat protein translocase